MPTWSLFYDKNISRTEFGFYLGNTGYNFRSFNDSTTRVIISVGKYIEKKKKGIPKIN